MFDSHPLLDIAEGMEGEWREGGGRVGLIERIIADILTIGDAALSALRRTGGGEEIAEFSEDSRISLLSLHIACVFVLQQIRVAPVFSLHLADVGGAAVEERSSCGGVETFG